MSKVCLDDEKKLQGLRSVSLNLEQMDQSVDG